MSYESDLQKLFFGLIIQWGAEALIRGYEITWGEAFRTDEQAEINAIGPQGREIVAKRVEVILPVLAKCLRNNGETKGLRKTAHGRRLAIDLNLFKNGIYLTKTEDWKELGEYWETLHSLCRWGGRFGDGNHLSMEFEGVK